MELLPFYLCLLAILFQASFASSFLNGKSASLSTNKAAPFKSRKRCSKAKPIAGKLIWRKKLPSTRESRDVEIGEHSKTKDVMVKENKSKSLIELLPKALVKLVIDYFSDESYSILVSTYSWLLKDIREVAVDSARVYVIVESDGIKSLDHSLGNVKEDERRCVAFGDSPSHSYLQFSSSHDGRYVSYSHSFEASTGRGEQMEYSFKWLMQNNEPEDGRTKSVTLDGEYLPYALLSRDGQTLCSYNGGANPITRVYQVRKGSEKDPVAFLKFELNGEARAVSGKGNRIMVEVRKWFEIHDISKDASELVCQIDLGFGYTCALNEGGNEAAFIDANRDLTIMKVDKVVCGKACPSVLVTVKIPASIMQIYKLVYADGGKLHVLHDWSKISLIDPSTKELIRLEGPQEGHVFNRLTISPNADYVAILLGFGERNESGRFKKYQTVVKRKLGKADWKIFFGYEADKVVGRS